MENKNGLEIAVIGISLRFPGANNLDQFWQNLRNGVESISFFNDEELEKEGIEKRKYTQDNYIKAKGILENIEYFDSDFFSYLPKEANQMDPQIRLLHECVWEALEDSCIDPGLNNKIGLYTGASLGNDWIAKVMLSGISGPSEIFSVPQLCDKDFISSRISYKLNLHGPSSTIFTACSTSLVCIHQACQGLLSGECNVAAAGAASVSIPVKSGYYYQEGMINSKDGHCRPFDANAGGTLFSSGVGIVVLKCLDDAIRDRDNIYAVIKGSAVNNDGNRKVGFTAPSITGQAEVIKTALKVAEVSPESIGYVEAHGTGTSMGDPIEMEALKKAFNTTKRKYCRIGSVKANIGHLDTSAGISGFIKAVLALKNRQIPPQINFTSPNPQIDFENSPFLVNTELFNWNPDNEPLRAAVSSFGVGGTNAHIILEEYSEDKSLQLAESNERRHKLFCFSAKSSGALENVNKRFLEFINQKSDLNLADAAYALNTGRKQFQNRNYIIAESLAELKEKLSVKADLANNNQLNSEADPAIIFMFPEQGSQYTNMGFHLYNSEPVFRKEIDHCFDLVSKYFAIQLKTLLYTNSSDNVKDQCELSKASSLILFCFEYSLAKFLISLGIQPTSMIGANGGEYVAACLSNVFSLDDALKLVYARAKLMDQLSSEALLKVPISAKELSGIIEDVCVLSVNGDDTCVISGSVEKINNCNRLLKERGISGIFLDETKGLQSQDLILNDFNNIIRQVQFNNPEIPYFSNVSGTYITKKDATDPEYYVNHLRKTGKFIEGVNSITKKDAIIFIEVGPGEALCKKIQQNSENKTSNFLINLVRERNENITDDKYFTDKLGQLWSLGVTINWNIYYQDEKRRRISLPTYPFDKKKHWIDTDIADSKYFQTKSDSNNIYKKEISDWVYIPSWRRTLNPKPVLNKNRDAKVLIFKDSDALSDSLIEKFSKDNIVLVSPGSEFVKTDHAQYELSISKPDDFVLLFQDLVAENFQPDIILNFWNLSVQASSDSSINNINDKLTSYYYSLISIFKAIGRQMPDKQVNFVLFTENVYEVTGNDSINPEGSIALGPIRTANLELKNIKCKNIDLAHSDYKKVSTIEIVYNEIFTESLDYLVAYRNNYKWIQTFESLDKTEEREIIKFKSEGVYLITGGLGAIGLQIARFLAENYKTSLILVGRSYLPPKTEWDEWLSNHSKNNSISLKILEIKEIERLGGSVEYCAVDISNYEQVSSLIRNRSQKQKLINGVIHAAGIADGALMQARKNEQSQEVLKPKVFGTLALYEALKEQHLDFFLLFSSIYSIVGGIGQMAYISANSFMDSFANSMFGKNDLNIISINWDLWQDIGMLVNEETRRLVQSNFLESKFETIDHPLISQRYTPNSNIEVFKVVLNVEKHWFLDEHRIKGSAILLGTMYVELARAAYEINANAKIVTIQDVSFLNPLLVAEKESKELYIFLIKQHNSTEFNIFTRSNSEPENWKIHARGEFVTSENETCGQYNIDEIKQRCSSHKISILEQGVDLFKGFIEVGPRWKSLDYMHIGSNEAVGYLKLDEVYNKDLDIFRLHPAMLDLATSGLVLVDFLPKREDGYLPFSYGKLTIYGNLPSACYCWVKFNKEEIVRENNCISFHIKILSLEGNVVVDIENFSLLTVSNDGKEYTNEKKNLYNVSILDIFKMFGNISSGINFLNSSFNKALELGIKSNEGIDLFSNHLVVNSPQIIVSTYDLGKRLSLNKSEKKDIQTKEDNLSLQLNINSENFSQELQKIVFGIWANELGLNDFRLDDDFFALGGDSLKALSVINKIQKELKVTIPLADFFNKSTINKITEFIVGLGENSFLSITPAPEKEYYSLSSTQKRLYFLQILENNTTSYNETHFGLLEGSIDIDKLKHSINKLIQRHEVLRTSVEVVNGEPLQKINLEVECDFQFEKVNESEIEEIIKEHIQPFNLQKAPLFKIRLFQIDESKYVFFIDLHHIITDGTSIYMFFRELLLIYADKQLPELKLQYKDYTEWQNNDEQKKKMLSQETFWLKKLSGELPTVDLPLDYKRPIIQSFEGDTCHFTLSKDEVIQIYQFLKQEEVTLFMFLVSTIDILLSKISGQNDIIIGTPIAGRNHTDLHNLMGNFVNTLALRNNPSPEKKFVDFLKETKIDLLEVFDNQDYAYSNLVEKVVKNRDISRNPIFDVMFNLHNYNLEATGIPVIEIENLAIKPYEYTLSTSKFDLMIQAQEGPDELSFTFTYGTNLFKRSTIEGFIKQYKQILKTCLANKNQKIAEIQILSPEVKNTLIYELNNTCVEYPRKTIHQLFEEQALKTPGATAVVYNDDKITYEELNKKANQLARQIKETGVNKEDIIALKLNRSVEMMIGLLGILKSGCGYLPIDPEYPQDRINYMLENSGAKLLVSQSELVTSDKIKILCVDDPLIKEQDTSNLNIGEPGNIAYLIYTSGSTGIPKGIVIEHRNVVNFITGVTSKIAFEEGKTILSLTTISFDIFVLETILALSAGLKVVIGGFGEQNDLDKLSHTIKAHNVEMLQLTPSRLKLVLSGDGRKILQNIKTMMVGGEAFPEELFTGLKECYDGRIYNMYGPTETTVWSTIKELTNESKITLGEPIANTQIFILDDNNQIQPYGVPGELCIGGDGLARGYWKLDDLTREKFISNPFIKGGRIYKTGDLAIRTVENEIEFKGRKDNQLKIRGYRIEPEEIEKVLLNLEEVKEAVVIAKEKGTEKYLSAYIVAESELSVARIREHLLNYVPDYMIPLEFTKIDSIPLTPNGKTDRKKLAKVEGKKIQAQQSFVAPQTDMEQLISDAWKSTLNVDKEIGLDDNFFDLGGTSFDIIRLSEKLKGQFNSNDIVMVIFKYPTIRAISNYLTDNNDQDNTTDRYNLINKGKSDKKRIYEKRKKTNFNQ